MESEHAGGLSTDTAGAIRRWDVAMYMFVLLVIGGGDLGQQASNHLDDVCDWHGANLVLAADILLEATSAALGLGLETSRRGEDLLIGKAANMRQVVDLDATRGGSFGTTQGVR